MTDTSHQYFGSPDADDLVIFIHGLCGDATTTWTNKTNTTNFVFPEELARDFAKEKQPAYIVSFNYVSRLQGGPSVLSIADHLEFEIGELLKKHPYRTLRIVAHSMGGLVAREYLLRRQLRAHPELRVTNIVLLATPNNGTELAEFGRLISRNRQIEELRHIDKGNTYLESLNKDWNREFKGGGHPRHVLLYAGYEELATSVIGKPVKMSSAIAYADESMGFQQNHIGIAKPKDANDVIYRWVKAKLEESLEKTARQLLDGMIQQGTIIAADLVHRLPRTVELLEGLQALAGTELAKVLTYVKAGQFQAALAFLAESEPTESQMIESIAQRRFTQGEIHELQFQMPQAASYYSQAVQLAPSNALYRYRYGWFLVRTGEARIAIPQFEQAVSLSPTSGNMFIEGDALGGLGVAHFDLGQYAKAIEYHGQALAISRKVGDAGGEGTTLGNLGNVYRNLGQYAKAIEYHEQALAISRKIGDVGGEGTHLGNLGIAYADLRQFAKAIQYFEQALAIRRRIGDLRGEGQILGNLGLAYSDLGEYAKAVEYHNQSLAISRKSGNLRGESNTLENLGIAFRNLDQYPDAIEYHEQALAISRKIGDLYSEGTTLGNLGNVYRDLGQYAEAIKYHEQALAIRRKIGDLRGEGNSLGNLCIASRNLEQYAKAIAYCEQALAISEKLGDLRAESGDLANLGLAYADSGQTAKAIEFLEKSRVIIEDRLRITFPLKAELDRLKNRDRD